MVLQQDGSISCYQERKFHSHSTRGCPPGEMFEFAAMGFNSSKVLVILAAARSGNLYLGAPEINQWTSLRRQQFSCYESWTIGLSPDAEYAFWVETKEHVHKWRVREHLQLEGHIAMGDFVCTKICWNSTHTLLICDQT